MKTTTPPAARTGRCGALCCNCDRFRKGEPIAGWITCACHHTQASHAREDQP